ncbi:MAG: ABC transporter permease [Anaerolineae bacterium]|nr:ABC transporter permease [Anaerolineae bacterium]
MKNFRLSDIFSKPAVGPLLSLLLISIFFATRTPRFLTPGNFSLILQQVLVVGTLAIGQTVVILTSGIDLSNGWSMAFGGIAMTTLAVNYNIPSIPAIFLGLLTCTMIGLLNGLLVTYVNLPPFIVTLGTLSIAQALTLITSNAQTITDLPEAMTFLGTTFKVAGTDITYGTILMLVLFFIAWFVLQYTTLGRQVYAVGDNPEAARLAGINTTQVLIGVYAVAGLIYGLAALLLVARTSVGDPNAGTDGNLNSITAVVLGGTSLMGGRGNLLGTLVGAIIIGVIINGLTLMGIPSIFQMLITGILIILAVTVDVLSHRGK